MDWRQRLRNAFTEDSPWPWLAYLALFFFPWFFRAPQTDELIVAAIALPLFLVLYFRGYSACDWRAIAYAAAIATIGFGAIPIMPSAGVFLVYAGSMVGGVRPARLAIAWLVLLVLAIAAYGLILDLPLFAWGPVAFFTGMIGFANYMWAEMRKKNEALQAANAKVQQLATQAERERIDKDRLARENARRAAQGLPELKSSEELADAKFPDTVLDQAAEVMTDMVTGIRPTHSAPTRTVRSDSKKPE